LPLVDVLSVHRWLPQGTSHNQYSTIVTILFLSR